MASLSSQYEKADTCGLDFIFICLKTDFFKRSFLSWSSGGREEKGQEGYEVCCD